MSALRVGGFTSFSASDFPGHLAAVVFCQGCPWRCVYCHNPHLQPSARSGEVAWADVVSVLERRRGRLDAVVFSGGEPTLQADLLAAIEQVRELGFRVGLHTAGIYPERLEAVLSRVDWVGLDLKAPLQSYERITRVPGSGGPVLESLELLARRGIDHEIRCTWHPSLLSAADLVAMLEAIKALTDAKLVLQPYRPIGCFEPLPELRGEALERFLAELPDQASRLKLRTD